MQGRHGHSSSRQCEKVYTMPCSVPRNTGQGSVACSSAWVMMCLGSAASCAGPQALVHGVEQEKPQPILSKSSCELEVRALAMLTSKGLQLSSALRENRALKCTCEIFLGDSPPFILPVCG